ncbi:MAG: hypothetical protein D3909_11190 [Candidatus Electrothrix sp. ATG1]|nr:hypothetical protein [Candidatus Electrothrix sp. ATG1]
MLTKQGVEPKEVIEARKEKIDRDAAWQLLRAAQEVIVGRGKKIEVFSPTEENKGTILKVCLGRTGNLRAPALQIGTCFVVGFNDAMYEQYVK